MIGCVGRIGYVFMPTGVYPPSSKIRYQMDGQECDAPPDENPIGEGQIPDVNSIAAIMADDTLLLSDDAIVSHLGSFPPVHILKDATTGRCRVVRARPLDVPGDLMKAGAKVKILGYRTFTSERSEVGSAGAVTRHEQLLFALVLVLTDTK